jgi:hypothetical protein
MTADSERHQDQLNRIFAEADREPGGPGEDPLAPDIPPDRTRQFTHVNFTRMRTQWKKEEQVKLAEIARLADVALAKVFADAWWLLERIYRVAREPLADGDGVIMKDTAGHIKWKRNELGYLIEDWSKLGHREADDFLHELAIHLAEWEQQAAQMWGSAMFAKGIWEEKFAWGYTTYDAPGRRTIDDRTQYGHIVSIEERYFAIFQSMLSRRADALIRSLTRIYGLLERKTR